MKLILEKCLGALGSLMLGCLVLMVTGDRLAIAKPDESAGSTTSRELVDTVLVDEDRLEVQLMRGDLVGTERVNCVEDSSLRIDITRNLAMNCEDFALRSDTGNSNLFYLPGSIEQLLIISMALKNSIKKDLSEEGGGMKYPKESYKETENGLRIIESNVVRIERREDDCCLALDTVSKRELHDLLARTPPAKSQQDIDDTGTG